MKTRWLVVALALLAGIAFAISVQGGRWWVSSDVEIGPFGAQRCFGGSCEPTGLVWGTERWARIGMGTWAGGLISTFLLVVVAARVAAKRIPRLAAKTALVSVIATALAGALFAWQFPRGVEGVQTDRGVWLFGAGAVLGAIAALLALRMRDVAKSAPAQ